MPKYKLIFVVMKVLLKSAIGLVLSIAIHGAHAMDSKLCIAASRYAEVAYGEKVAGVPINDARGTMLMGLSQEPDMKSLGKNEQAMVAEFVSAVYEDVYSNNYRSSNEASKGNLNYCSRQSQSAEAKIEKNRDFCNDFVSTIVQISSIKMLGDSKELVQQNLLKSIYPKDRLDMTASIIDLVYQNEITDNFIQGEYLRCIKGE